MTEHWMHNADHNEEGLSTEGLFRKEKFNKQIGSPDEGWQADQTRLSVAGKAGGKKQKWQLKSEFQNSFNRSFQKEQHRSRYVI